MHLRERIHIHLREGLNARSIEHNAKFAFRGLLGAFLIGFGAIFAKVMFYGLAQSEPAILAASSPIQHARNRPDILDRNGQLLATDIKVYWLYADPEHVIDPEDTAFKLMGLFPGFDRRELIGKLSSKSRFEWIQRGLTPRLAERVHKLGLPGLHLIPEQQRVYPAGSAAAHILGITNVDNVGLSGIERYVDNSFDGQITKVALGERPSMRLSIDLGVQHAFREELQRALERHKAAAAFGVVMDAQSGEVIASASLPDFDPNHREQALLPERQNRILTDTYEFGSVFKTFTIAMALDDGIVRRTDLIDTRTPLKVGRFTLRDRYGGGRLSVEDILVRSSNTGTARIALMAGSSRQREFLASLGLLDPLLTEAGPSKEPSEPKRWRPANTMTISYGHGIAVSPLAFASAAATIVNGGTRVTPTFLPATRPVARGKRVISKETSVIMRDLFRLTVQRGTGKRAAVPGIRIGGKTGTAMKVKDGRYTHDVLTTFVAAFPIDNPRYIVTVSLDEPKPTKEIPRTEAGHNAAPAAGEIIKRIAPMLSVTPLTQFDERGATSY